MHDNIVFVLIIAISVSLCADKVVIVRNIYTSRYLPITNFSRTVTVTNIIYYIILNLILPA